MGKEVYITDEERKKCRNVADAFRELYELTDVVVVDAGKYGLVKLPSGDLYGQPGDV